MRPKQAIQSIIACVIFVTLISGCKKYWLDEKANKNQSTPTRLKDFQAMLDALAILNNNVFSFGEVAADGHYAPEDAWQGADNAARNVYTWTKDLPFTNLASWEFTYRRILTCNIVLDGLPKLKTELISSTDLKEWENIKGQALFNRATCFFHLAQLFAEPFDPHTAASDLGIPMRLDSDVAQSSRRNSVKETYDQIINDTKEAANLLPDLPLSPTRGGKAAAYALLARTYLVMGDFDNTLSFADKCMQIQKDLLDYSKLSSDAQSIGGPPNFSNPMQNVEIIFFDLHNINDLSSFDYFYYYIDTSLYSLYSPNDLRRSIFFNVDPSNDIITFKGNYYSNPYLPFCGIATDEMYLIRAECKARKNDVTGAMNDLNALLEKRFDSSFVPLQALGAEDALNKVLVERRKELILRNVRWSDLRRLNTDDRFKVTITRTIGGKTYNLEANSYKYTFPIPDDVIEFSGMPQTAGW